MNLTPDTAPTLPCAIEAEKAVIGAALLWPSQVMPRVLPILDDHAMFHPAHEALWRTMRDLERTSQPIDPLTIERHLVATSALPKLRGVGGIAYLADLSGAALTPYGIEAHAHAIADTAILRQLVDLAGELRGAAMAPGARSEFVRELAEQKLVDLRASTAQQGPRQIGAGLRATLQRIEARVDERRAGGAKSSTLGAIPTGYPEIDRVTGGLRAGGAYVLASRPAMGKSALAMNVARNAARHGIPSLVFSMEMEEEELDERLIAAEAKVDATRLATGDLDAQHMAEITKAVGALNPLLISIDDSGGLTHAQIRARARRWRMSEAKVDEHPVGLLVVDYLQLLKAAESKREINREQVVADASRAMKALAKELRCAVIELAMVGRAVEDRADKRPTLRDLRESGQIEADADLVAFLYRDHVYNPKPGNLRDAEFIIAKQRKGPTLTIPLHWIGEHQLFVPVAL